MFQLLLAVIYLAFISLGLPDSLIGAGWPVMHEQLGVPVAYAGIITMVISVGTIVSSLLSDRLTRALGAGLVTTISVAMTAAALLGFSVSGSFWMLCLWALPYGLGAGAVDAALNNYVALHYASRHMNWLHSFWGVGASISPFIMSFALTHNLGWEGGYRTVGYIQIAITVVLILSLPLWKKPSRNSNEVTSTESPDPKPTDGAPIKLKEALKIRGVKQMLIAFLAYCAFESSSTIWSSTYLVQQREVMPATAAAFASLYLLGITAGRFLSGFVSDRLGDRQMIRIGLTTAGLGYLLIALPLPFDTLALAGLVIAGFGSAPVYPAIIHATPVNFGRDNSQAIIGIQMAAAYTGTALFPPLYGVLSQWIGMWLFPFFLLFLVALGLVMSHCLNVIVDQRDGNRA